MTEKYQKISRSVKNGWKMSRRTEIEATNDQKRPRKTKTVEKG